MTTERPPVITRDNAASISGTAQNARQRLGEVIAHYMAERGFDDHRVARTCSVPIRDVERWRSGEVVPSSDQWQKLKRSVNGSLSGFAELYQRARKEAETEARERAAKTMTPTTRINSITDKLSAVVAAAPVVPAALEVKPPPPTISIVRDPDPKPTATSDTAKVTRGPYKRLAAPPPPGAFGAVAIAKRAEFVRNLLRQRPNIRTTGRDSVVELVRATFGVGISPPAIEEIRAEVAAECHSPNTHDEHKPAPAEATTPAPEATIAPERLARFSADPEHEINAAVAMILDAIPNLQTFTVTVDDKGEASVDYQIRKVVITTDGGSFKVRR